MNLHSKIAVFIGSCMLLTFVTVSDGQASGQSRTRIGSQVPSISKGNNLPTSGNTNALKDKIAKLEEKNTALENKIATLVTTVGRIVPIVNASIDRINSISVNIPDSSGGEGEPLSKINMEQ